ncbi:ATP-grasp domain-containing protein [Acidisoma cellulosilytica]|uniref:ATP-grasp domain-containing protein n=1 Tax=Acidisoma cellulosilyticum TaxID=2802395 RepID=A0A964E4D1_9PROT|nr:ATP-grasp domain-containing protein [Acidisoma cellulosilyticum]MCB8881565.1 ATP-grasp domain-containing protein [Acidisoma cellulosilyticum]
MLTTGESYGTAQKGVRARILFVALTNDVGIDKLPSALGGLGAACAVLCPPGFYCAESRFMGRRFALPAQRGAWLALPFIRSRLEAAAREWDADLIIALDDMAALCLRAIATSVAVSSGLRTLLETSFGSPRGYSAVCSRAELMQVASTLGLRLPRFCVSDDPSVVLQHAAAWGYPAVLKVENTCGGHGVTIARTQDDLRVAMATARGATSWKRLRGAMRRKIWGMAGLTGAVGTSPVLQSYLPGVPAMRTVLAWKGEVLDGVSFVAEQNNPAPTGPSTVVRPIENADMAEASRRLVAALGCSGFVSFDFMLEPATGQASLIELNPRPIGTSHLGRLFGHDLCARLMQCLDERFVPPAPVQSQPPQAVALFPKEIERAPHDLARLRKAGIYHDLPYDEPGVMAAYLRRLSVIHPQEFPEILRDIGAARAAVSAVPARRAVPSGLRTADRGWLQQPCRHYAEPRRHA